MTESIEKIREKLDELFKTNTEEMMKVMANTHEEILIAFCAKYGIHPEQAVSVYQNNKFWVEKRDDEHIKKMTQGRIKSYNSLYDKYNKLLAFIKEIINPESEMGLDEEYAIAKKLLKEVGEL
jgi:hypothetical protein